MHWFKGSKRWLSTILFLTEAETLAVSLWFSLLILCNVERTWICSDVWTYWKNYKATLKSASIKSVSIKSAGLCFAMLHHNTLCLAGTHSPDLPSCAQIWLSTSFRIFFFPFAFPLKFAWKLLWMSLVLWEESHYTPNFLMILIIYYNWGKTWQPVTDNASEVV